MTFVNADVAKDRIMALIAARPPRAVVIDIGATADLDVATMDMMAALLDELDVLGVELGSASPRVDPRPDATIGADGERRRRPLLPQLRLPWRPCQNDRVGLPAGPQQPADRHATRPSSIASARTGEPWAADAGPVPTTTPPRRRRRQRSERERTRAPSFAARVSPGLCHSDDIVGTPVGG
jgi:hypothetical protein